MELCRLVSRDLSPLEVCTDEPNRVTRRGNGKEADGEERRIQREALRCALIVAQKKD